MTAKNLFTTVAILCFVFGLSLLISPEFMAQQYLTDPSWMNDGTRLVARGWGAVLVANAVAYWYVRNLSSQEAQKLMLLLTLVTNLGYLPLHLVGIFNQVETPLAWLQVLMAVVMGTWSAMLLRREKTEAPLMA